MTLKQRNFIFSFLLLISIVALISYIILTLYVYIGDGGVAFFSLYRLDLLLIYFLQLSFVLAIMLISKNFYKTSISADFYFFVLFIFSMEFELFRLFILFSDIFRPDINSLRLLYRLIYLGYFIGLSSLFLFSFFSLSLSYQRIGRLSLWMIVFSVFMAWFMPLNTSLFFSSGIPLPLFTRAFGIFSVGVCILSVICIANGHDEYSSRFDIKKALFLIFIIIGRAILFFMDSPALYIIIAFLLLVTGSIYIIRKLYQKEIL
ncbi:hypothetical protein WKV44_01735 [Spirochaetia bacterium 38H-sp]|uniref:Uncharacterized protein n=1 Tax=Rarispira pelagica TaxID=3141764 RepID=A0ABU9U9B4_9SPIR